MSSSRCDFPYAADLERCDGFELELLGSGDSCGLEVRSITSDVWEAGIWEADSDSCTRWESLERVDVAGDPVSNAKGNEVCFWDWTSCRALIGGLGERELDTRGESSGEKLRSR